MRKKHIEEVVNYLKKDKIKNCNMINFIENNIIHDITKEGKSVLVKGTSDEDWVYISSSSEDEMKKLLDKYSEEEYFVAMENWMLPCIIQGKEIEWKLSCIKLYFPEDSLISDMSRGSDNKIYKLTLDDSQYIYENSKYKEYTSLKYIQDRITNGIALGVRENNKLIAWLMTHDDGAIGFLNVLKDYRRKGYGYYLTMSIIKELRDKGKVAFIHIEENNIKSMKLALKTGFKEYGKIHWIKRKI